MIAPMRNIIVRNLTSSDLQNRDYTVTETMKQGDHLTMVTRRCTYRIESHISVPSLSDSIGWAQNIDPQPPRQVFVTKDLDPNTGDERVTYKVLGRLYVVQDHDIYCVSYRHILSMAVESHDLPQA